MVDEFVEINFVRRKDLGLTFGTNVVGESNLWIFDIFSVSVFSII